MLDKLKPGDFISNGENWYKILNINDRAFTIAAWSRVTEDEEGPPMAREFDVVYEELKTDLEEYIKRVYKAIKYNEHWA